MLALDLSRSEGDLEKSIADHCARYGTVVNVRVLRQAGAVKTAVALVRMATVQSLDALVADIGATRSNTTAIIMLGPQDGDRRAAA